MELEFYYQPRLLRKIKNKAMQIDFKELFSFMERYGMVEWYYYLGNKGIKEIEDDVKSFDMNIDYIVCLGTGGSYQGIEVLIQFSEMKDRFLFIGPSLDPWEINEIKRKLDGKKVGFNIISKSGSTMETIFFINIFHDIISKAKWISVISSNKNFYESIKEEFSSVKNIKFFEISKNIGGRFSIVSNMGVVTGFMAKVDYSRFLDGFLDARKELEHEDNLSPIERGLARYYLFNSDILLENLATNKKKIIPTLKWCKQLLAESNGKEYKSMFVSVGFYPEDAHSVGQIWKEGPRNVTETFFILENDDSEDIILENKSTKFLTPREKSLSKINQSFIEAIIEDRFESGVPTTVYKLRAFTPYEWGRLIFTEMVAVVVEAYFLGVNPFNQPGVESYKKKVEERIM
ncbi:MAG TPA: hypothetical protein PKW55_07390 [Spirochaetota bacterium]|nr:hypothetical protein [Spirochaetota bacterium]HOM38596.1 hypothetical protein [Spirochaetota bacterium]HPQ49733.1 hypothetical protein [Spirochaetota bacterium]